MTAPDPALARLHAALVRMAGQIERREAIDLVSALRFTQQAQDELAAVVAERDAARAEARQAQRQLMIEGKRLADALVKSTKERDAARALLSEWAPLAWAGPTLNADSRCESCWRRLRVEDGIKNADPAKHEPNCRWVRTATALAPAGERDAGSP